MDLEHEKALEFVEGLKRQWMAMIDALVDPLMIVREDYTILKANRALAQMYGKQSVKEVLGLKCYTVFAARTSPCPGCQLKIAAKTQVVTHGSLDEIREGRYFETVSQPVFDSEGSLEGVVQLYRDRTDARRMQNQLLQSEKLASIGLLAGGVAHEINNPLGGILIFSQMILREMDKSSPHYSDVVEIENATQRCKEIVERLLDFARQRPEKPGALKDVSLVEVVDRALKFASVGPNANKADVKQNWKNPEAIVKADSNKLIQVFLNLLQNAIHAIKRGGKIVIRDREVTEDKIDYIVVDIEDSGSGMAPHTLKRIFDPFFTTKEPGEGTGLGLAICYSIMTEFKGKLTVKSELGVGTIFSVWFPKVN